MSVVMTPNEQREGRHRIDAENKKNGESKFRSRANIFLVSGLRVLER